MTRFRLPPVMATTPWSAGINLAGALGVTYGLWRGAPRVAPWVAAVMIAGLVAWVARTLLAARRGSRSGDAAIPPEGRTAERVPAAALLAVMTLGGAVTAIPTQGLGVALLAVAVLVVTSDPAIPAPIWCGVVAAGALGIAGGALLTRGGLAGPSTGSVWGLLAVLAALALAVVAGLGRRAQRVLLFERERANAEAVRAQATAHRVAIARDLHDVLAHSLGGLVVQLDAAEALLEAGDAERAAARVAAARRLAVSGLDEAREAVRTLRGPEQDGTAPAAAVDPAELTARLEALLDGEGAAGARLTETGSARPVSAALAEALVRAVQEGLSNARKHGPGSAVRIALIWHPDRVECTIENAVPAGGRHDGGALAATGGGFGLPGVRERFAAVGGTVRAGVMASGAGAVVFRLRVEAPA